MFRYFFLPLHPNVLFMNEVVSSLFIKKTLKTDKIKTLLIMVNLVIAEILNK